MASIIIAPNGSKDVTSSADYGTTRIGDNGTLNVGGGAVVNPGTLIVSGATATVNVLGGSQLSMTGPVTAGAGQTLNYNLSGGSSLALGGTVSFGGASANISLGTGNNKLILGNGLSLGSGVQISGFGAGDAIQYEGSATGTQYDAATGQLQFMNGTNAVASVHVGTGYTQQNFTYAGNTVAWACYLRGSRVLTPAGEVAIEELAAGDEVMALRAGTARIRWIGRRTVDPAAVARPQDAFPVRIRRDALGAGLPHRDLLLSPDHCILFEDRLVPAKLLVNGTTVVQDAPEAAFEYFHLELDEHDVITVEGALAETYLDTGNRAMFQAPGTVQFTPAGRARRWDETCFPMVFGGPVLQRLRAAIEVQAEALGHPAPAPQLAAAS